MAAWPSMVRGVLGVSCLVLPPGHGYDPDVDVGAAPRCRLGGRWNRRWDSHLKYSWKLPSLW